MNIVNLTNKEARALSNARKGLFRCDPINFKKYGVSYLGEADGNIYLITDINYRPGIEMRDKIDN